MRFLRIFLFFVLALCVGIPSPGYAGQAYKRFLTNNPDTQPWRDGISIYLETDVERCRKAYGDRWPDGCAAQLPGKPGSRVDSIKMTPAAKGIWRWISESTLKFYPAGHLQPSTNYTISLENIELSKRIEVNKNLIYTTPPQAVKIDNDRLWIDPSSKGKHILSIPMSFIWPCQREVIEHSIKLEVGGGSLRLGKPQFVWNEGNDGVVCNVPILQLPEKNTYVTARVSSMGGWHEEQGRRLFDRNAKSTEHRCLVLGVDSVMDVNDIQIKASYDENLSRGFEIVVTTSMQVLPKDVLDRLDILLLPKKSQDKGSQNCDWERMPALSQEDIKKSKVLKASLLQPGDVPATEIRLKVDVEANRGLVLAMKTGLASTSGFTLNRVRRFIKMVPKLESEINFLQAGNILPLRPNQKLDIHTIGLDRIDYRVANVRAPFMAILAQNADFLDTEDISFDNITVVHEGSLRLDGTKPYDGQYVAIDLSKLEQNSKPRASLMYLTLKGYRDGEEKASASRLILASDLALMLKTSVNGTQSVFVRHIASGEAAKDCDVSLLGANGTAVLKGRTNSEGRCELGSSYGLVREKKPVALFVSKGEDFAWLSLRDEAPSLNTGDFSTEGLHASEQGLLASVFSERGIYMPGDTLHFGTIVASQDFKAFGKTLAVTAILTNPAGQEIYKEKKEISREGMADFAWKSESDCITGIYRMDIALEHGNGRRTVLGSTSVRLEEFQPDTLSLKLGFDGGKPKGWIETGKKTTLTASLDTLYGEPAKGNRIKAVFESSPAKLTFEGYSDYSFMEGIEQGETEEIPLEEGYTDEKGKLVLTLPLEKMALGTRRGVLLVEGFEKSGGRAVSRRADALFSPRKYVLGWKSEGRANTLDYLPEGSEAKLRLLLLNSALVPQKLDKVKVSVSARRFVKSLVQDEKGLYRYEACPVDSEISQKIISLDPAGTLWPIDTKRAGDYLLRISDNEGENLALIPYSVAGNTLAKPGEEPVLVHGKLRLTVEKEHYNAGETVHFRISAPFAGTGLVTIERENVVASAWFKAEAGESVHSITLPKDFEGRGYLNVSYGRSLQSDAIYMEPHVYGIVPITCAVAKRDMGIEIRAPKAVLPNQDVTFHVSAKKKGLVQLFCVDEGVLQLTNFTLPSPIRDLLTNRALDVETREAYSLIMPDHERLLGRIPGFGGGMGGAGGRFLNPFRRKNEPPVAFWAKALEVDEKGADIVMHVPSYFSGTLRVMAVGSALGSDGYAFGSSETKTQVRGDLIVKPQLPLVLAPKDRFEGALVIANTVERSGKKARVHVSLRFPKEVRVLGAKEGDLVIPENEEGVFPFRCEVLDGIGEFSLEFQAKLHGAKNTVSRAQSLSIRPATPRIHRESMQTVAALGEREKGLSIANPNELYPYHAETSLSLARGPILALRSLIDQLDEYPFSCTEQKISMAFPYVVLWDAAGLRKTVLQNTKRPLREQEKLGEKRIQEAVSAIRASLGYDGVSIWPQSGEESLFMTAYAADFLLSMREHGLTPPDDLVDRIFSILERKVANSPVSVSDGRNKIYAAWILQRDGRIMTSQLTSLEDWFVKNASNWEKDVLASLLADGFATLRLRRRALARLPESLQRTDDPLFSESMARALHATILARDFAGERKLDQLINPLVEQAVREHSTTIDKAMSARALLDLMTKKTEPKIEAEIACEAYGEGFAGNAEQRESAPGLLSLSAPGCARFSLKGTLDPSYSLLLTTDGYEKRQSLAPKGKIEVQKTVRRNGEAVKSLSLGDVATISVCARSQGKPLHDAVIVDLVAGGLEPVIEGSNLTQGEGFVRYERREDRALFFVDLVPHEDRCFAYEARAATKGSFILPPAHAEGMYMPGEFGESKGGSIEVK